MTVDLERRIIKSGAMVIGGQAVSLFLRLASTLIMTRLLAPDAFGVMAIAIVVQTIVALLSDVGISQAVVQSRHGASPTMLNTAWILQISRGAVIHGVCIVIAVLVLIGQWQNAFPPGSAYTADVLPWVIIVLSLSALITGFQSTKAITAERSVNFSRITILEAISQLVGLIFMAVFGFLTGSVWALVAGSLITAAVKVVMSHTWLEGERNRFAFDKTSAREIITFGRWLLLSSALFVISSNGDRLLIGAWTDTATLGLYAIALTLVSIVEGTANRLYAGVGYAALSETVRENPADFRARFYRLRLPFDAALLFASGAGFAAGHVIVDILYDQRYAGAGKMLEILFLMLIVTRMALCGHAYIALGHPRLLLPIHGLKVVSFFIVVPLAYKAYGFDGALWAIALHELPLIPLLFYLNSRMSLLSLRFELLILLVWPVGYLVGSAVSALIQLVH